MECLDVKNIGSLEINKQIKEMLRKDGKLKITNPHAMHNLGIALKGSGSVYIEGSTGYFTGGFLKGPSIRIEGNTGWYTGDNMSDGEIIISGNAGSNCGPAMLGGTLLVRGNAGSRAGYGMKGGNLIVCGDVGRWPGYMTMGGRMIVLGKLGDVAGESMYKGVIHSCDPDIEKKMGTNVNVIPIADDEKKELEKLFKKYGIEHSVDKFKSIIPLASGRHNYILFEPTHKRKREQK